MGPRTKLLLLIPHLGGGGAERVAALLARYLDPRDFEVHLCLPTRDMPGAQPIPRWVQVHRFNFRRVRYACLHLVHLIRAEQPDVVLSGMAHLNFLLLLLRPLLPARTRIFVRQNTTASSAAPSRLARLLYRHLYPYADAILCQSEAMASDLAGSFAIPREKLKVVANPIDVASIRACTAALQAAVPEFAWPRLLVVSRLAPEKGLDLLLRAMPRLRQQHPRVHLAILGIGPEEAALRRLVHELDLAPSVSFAGHCEHLGAYYSKATLFVLPSRCEGMPNALLEAAAAGLPIVATPCSAGLRDLLCNAPGTWLTESISSESLAHTILAVVSQLSAPLDSPLRFHHGFLAPFERSAAIAAYAALIQQHAAPENA